MENALLLAGSKDLLESGMCGVMYAGATAYNNGGSMSIQLGVQSALADFGSTTVNGVLAPFLGAAVSPTVSVPVSSALTMLALNKMSTYDNRSMMTIGLHQLVASMGARYVAPMVRGGGM